MTSSLQTLKCTLSLLKLLLILSCSVGATSALWGAKYGGSDTNSCSQFPSALQAGCEFRWNWFQGADNPTVNWETVACPSALTDKSGCVRTGDTPTGSSYVPTYTGTAWPSAISTSTSTAVTSTVTNPASCAATEYGQCGGTGWTVRPRYPPDLKKY